MTNLPRLRPEPIPAISPLPEYLAEGQRKMWYEEVKQVLQVPWMGVITMAYAPLPDLLRGVVAGGARSVRQSAVH